ncbi:MAG: radical SAM/SPASM domain-containing protein [Candidatus Micrarchaeia archaeon]
MKKVGELREVKFEVTASCNHSCSFCFNKNAFAQKGRFFQELSTQDAFKVIDNTAESAVETIRFTGGEPLMRSDLVKLCKYAKANNLRVRLNSNGSFFNKRLLLEVSRFADEVFFPLHALDAVEDFGKTGLKGAFKRKISAMKALLASGVKVRAGTIASRDNILRLEDFARLAENCCDQWFMLRPIPTAGNKHSMDFEDVKALAVKLETLAIDCKMYHAVPFCSTPNMKMSKVSVGAMYCGPLYNLVVRPNGVIAPCYSINENLGNALHDSIREVWEAHPFVKKSRELGFLPKKCQACSFKEVCAGGCRFAAKICNGTYSSKDPLMP